MSNRNLEAPKDTRPPLVIPQPRPGYGGGCLVVLLLLGVVVAALSQFGPGPRRFNPFQQDLVAVWSLDEASGTRMDCWGTNHLTAINSPVTVPGKLNQAASFRTAASQQFTAVCGIGAAQGPDLNFSNISFTVAGWIFISNSPPSYFGVFGNRSSASPFTNDQWAVDCISATGLRMSYTIGSSANNTITNFTTITNSWMLMFAWCDLGRGFIGGTLYTTNGFEWQERAKTVPSGRGSTFELGCIRTSSYWPGMLDDVAVWRRMLSTNEMTTLWNLGHGGLANFITKRR